MSQFSVLGQKCCRYVNVNCHSGPWGHALGKGPVTKSDEFSEKFQTVFDPPPSISENYITIIFMIEMVAYMQGGMMAR